MLCKNTTGKNDTAENGKNVTGKKTTGKNATAFYDRGFSIFYSLQKLFDNLLCTELSEDKLRFLLILSYLSITCV